MIARHLVGTGIPGKTVVFLITRLRLLRIANPVGSGTTTNVALLPRLILTLLATTRESFLTRRKA
jgi:hypothetical protein